MNWCSEIYRGLFILPSGEKSVEISPCCQAHTSIICNSEFNFYDSTILNKFRTENVEHIQSNECQRCWKSETHGQHSKRQSAIDFYNITYGDTTVELNSLEYNVNWACNLACIMCSANFSSTWARELEYSELQINKQDKIFHTQNKILEKVDLSKLKRIHFNGGEPLINDDHCKVLEKIQTLDECKITYNTNGTKLPTKKALEYWNKAKVVRLFFSIDAIEGPFEYIRWHAKWDNIQKNIEWYINESPSNVMFGLNVTIGGYNLLEVKDVYDWYQSTLPANRSGDQSDFNWQQVYSNEYDYKYLAQNIKEKAIQMLTPIPDLNSIRISIEKNFDVLPSYKWIDKLNIIDARRQTNWKDVLKIGRFY